MSRRRVPSRPPEAARGAPRARAKPPAEPPRVAPELAVTQPAYLIPALVAAACVLVSVTYRIIDSDLWQHLAVGRAIWELHAVPQGQIWCWPGYGEPYVTPSWAFRALLWPFWSAGGVTGLFAWRWLATLAAFALLWATARRMGARGLTPLVVLVIASLVYRARSQVRPETLASILFALELWILETRRTGGRDHTRWLVPIAWAWANIHISYPLAFVLLAVHHAGGALGAWLKRRRGRGGPASRAAGGVAMRGAAAAHAKGEAPAVSTSILRRDALTVLAMVGISFLNPYGWRTLAQPFEYYLVWRHEQIYKTVIELEAVSWRSNLMNGLPVLVVGWPLLILWRARRGALDAVEALFAAYLIATALPTQRFTGLLALGAAPYLARDLDEWVRARRWPAWTAPAKARALLATLACVGLGLPEWLSPPLTQGVGFQMEWFPVRACDFIAAHGVRGRAYNDYYHGGYMLWRFWPDRTRRPFMDIHQTGTREDRRLTAYVPTDPTAWSQLEELHHFDYALLNRYRSEGDRSLESLDADQRFALVFMDDNAAVYVRREGPLEAVADSFAYRVIPGGAGSMRALGSQLAADSTLRERARAELERVARSSEFNSSAHSNLANLAMLEGRFATARAELESTLTIAPWTPYTWERLALVALGEGRPRAALWAIAREKSTREHREVRERIRGDAKALERELESQRRELVAALQREPGRRDLADSLAAVERRLAR